MLWDACSSVFLGPQQFSITSLSSFLQHLGGCADLTSSGVQQFPHKLDMFPFLALGENICRHRRAFDPLKTCFVAGQALLDHAGLNSEAFVSDVLLAADPAARRASAKLLHSFTHRASVI